LKQQSISPICRLAGRNRREFDQAALVLSNINDTSTVSAKMNGRRLQPIR
jgi:hypothetical protein